MIFRCQLSAAKGLKIKILRFAQNDKRQFPKKSIVEGLAKYMIGTMRLIRKKTLIRAIVVAAFVLLLAACGLAVWLKAWPRQNNTVADRAYSWRTGDDCLVYIEESGGFEPYIVLTADYGGNALLLRKFLLPDKMPFNENESHGWGFSDFGGYYEDSTIDKYLNTFFYDTLSQTTKDAIVESNVVIYLLCVHHWR